MRKMRESRETDRSTRTETLIIAPCHSPLQLAGDRLSKWSTFDLITDYQRGLACQGIIGRLLELHVQSMIAITSSGCDRTDSRSLAYNNLKGKPSTILLCYKFGRHTITLKD